MDDIIRIYDNYSGGARFNQAPSSLNKYLINDTIVILLCLKGQARFNVRFKEYLLTENSFIAIGAGIPFYYTEKSDDITVNIITITESGFDKLVQGLIKIYFNRMLNESPLHSIPEEKMKMCGYIHEYLKNFVKTNDNYFKKQIIRSYLNILFYESCNIMLHEPNNRLPRDRHKEDIAENFIRLLEKNFRNSRKVEFYAKELNITPKYLSATVKESTGKTASAWIDEYTIMEARTMLRNGTSTIQEISYDLGFSTPSHFSKFFKDKTGRTPKQERTGVGGGNNVRFWQSLTQP